MSKHLVIPSCVVLHLSINLFCCGVSGMVFSCRMPASKQYILNCSERNLFALSCLSFLGIPTLRRNFFGLASASFFALIKSTNKNFKYWSANTMQKRNPVSDCTVKGPMTSVNTLFSFYSSWVSATIGTGGFVIFAIAHTLQNTHVYIIEFPHCLWRSPDHIRLIQTTQLSVPLPCTVKFHAVGTHLEF